MSQAVQVTTKRAVVVAVQLTGVSDPEFESSLSELRELAKTLGFEVVATFTQKRATFDATAYLGTGKREELRRFVQGEAAPDPAAEDLPAGATPPLYWSTTTFRPRRRATWKTRSVATCWTAPW